MRKKSVICILIVLVSLFVLVPPPNTYAANTTPVISASKCYGGAKDDVFTDFCRIPDAGYASVGYTNSSSDGDVPENQYNLIRDWVLKLNDDFSVGWKKVYSANAYPQSVRSTSKYLYVYGGVSDENDALSEAYRIFHRTISIATGTAVFSTLNPNYYSAYYYDYTDYLAAISQTYPYHTKGIEYQGDPSWFIGLDDVSNLSNPWVSRTKDNGYFFICSTNGNTGKCAANKGGYDLFLLRLAPDRSVKWYKMLGGAKDEYIDSVIPTADGGCVIAGYTTSNTGDVSGNHGGKDAWIIKLDAQYNVSWKKCYGGSGDDMAKAIYETADHGYLVACTSYSNNGDVSGNHGGGDYWVFKINSSGTLLWGKCFGGSDKEDASAILQTGTGDIVVAGTAYSANGDVIGHHGTTRNADGWVLKIKEMAECTVQFNSSGGSAVAPLTAPYNTTIKAPANPTRNGYTFAGWYKEPACTHAWNFSTDRVTANITLYAKWALAKYTVKAVVNNTAYGTVAGAGQYNYGAAVTLKAVPKAGCRFVRWMEGTTQVSVSPQYSFKATKSRTIKAEFARIGTPAITLASAGYNAVKISWSAVAGARQYEVYRASSDKGTYTRIATVSATSMVNTGLTTGKYYYYKVRAKCTTGTVVTYGGYCYRKYVRPIPATPSSIKAVKSSSTGIKLTWSWVAGTTKYEVWRSTSANGKYTFIASTSGTSYTNKGLARGKTYYYKVRSYRLVGSTKVYGNYSRVVYVKL